MDTPTRAANSVGAREPSSQKKFDLQKAFKDLGYSRGQKAKSSCYIQRDLNIWRKYLSSTGSFSVCMQYSVIKLNNQCIFTQYDPALRRHFLIKDIRLQETFATTCRSDSGIKFFPRCACL